MTVMGTLPIWSKVCQVVSSQVLEVIQIAFSLATGQTFKTVYYFKKKKKYNLIAREWKIKLCKTLPDARHYCSHFTQFISAFILVQKL